MIKLVWSGSDKYEDDLYGTVSIRKGLQLLAWADTTVHAPVDHRNVPGWPGMFWMIFGCENHCRNYNWECHCSHSVFIMSCILIRWNFLIKLFMLNSILSFLLLWSWWFWYNFKICRSVDKISELTLFYQNFMEIGLSYFFGCPPIEYLPSANYLSNWDAHDDCDVIYPRAYILCGHDVRQ